MKIGIDLDEVLAEFLLGIIKYHNLTYGTSLTKDDFFSYKYWEVWGGTKDQATKEVYDFHKTDFFRNIKPVAFAKEAVNELKEGNELYVITSRQDDIEEDTKEWIKKYFPNSFKDIYLTNNYSSVGVQRSKKQICNELGIEVFIDDSLEYATECCNNDRKVFLINRPWNQSESLAEGIRRVNSLEEIISILRG